MTMGSRGMMPTHDQSPFQTCQSLRQMPLASTRRITPLGRSGGVGTSRTTKGFSVASSTAARMPSAYTRQRARDNPPGEEGDCSETALPDGDVNLVVQELALYGSHLDRDPVHDGVIADGVGERSGEPDRRARPRPRLPEVPNWLAVAVEGVRTVRWAGREAVGEDRCKLTDQWEHAAVFVFAVLRTKPDGLLVAVVGAPLHGSVHQPVGPERPPGSQP